MKIIEQLLQEAEEELKESHKQFTSIEEENSREPNDLYWTIYEDCQDSVVFWNKVVAWLKNH